MLVFPFSGDGLLLSSPFARCFGQHVPSRYGSSTLANAYAFSMAKLRPRGNKTGQNWMGEVFDFQRFRWVALYRVAARIALITRKSSVQICPPQPFLS